MALIDRGPALSVAAGILVLALTGAGLVGYAWHLSREAAEVKGRNECPAAPVCPCCLLNGDSCVVTGPRFDTGDGEATYLAVGEAAQAKLEAAIRARDVAAVRELAAGGKVLRVAADRVAGMVRRIDTGLVEVNILDRDAAGKVVLVAACHVRKADPAAR